MPGNEPISLALLACFALLCAILWRISGRWREPAAREMPGRSPSSSALHSLHLPLLCVFLCAVGAIMLLPWIAFLPAARLPGLLPGIGLIALLSIGAFYVLGRREDGD
jgi:hypothetical protein